MSQATRRIIGMVAVVIVSYLGPKHDNPNFLFQVKCDRYQVIEGLVNCLKATGDGNSYWVMAIPACRVLTIEEE